MKALGTAVTGLDRAFCRAMAASVAVSILMLIYSASVLLFPTHAMLYWLTLALIAWRLRQGPFQSEAQSGPGDDSAGGGGDRFRGTAQQAPQAAGADGRARDARSRFGWDMVKPVQPAVAQPAMASGILPQPVARHDNLPTDEQSADFPDAAVAPEEERDFILPPDDFAYPGETSS
jgi:hypothetical protein